MNHEITTPNQNTTPLFNLTMNNSTEKATNGSDGKVDENVTNASDGTGFSENVTNGSDDTGFSVTIGYALGGILALCIVISLVILITIHKGKTGGFFNWKIFDRFTVYTIVCDLIYYVSSLILTVYWSFTRSAPEGILCTMIGISVTLSAMCQSIMTAITAIFVHHLVVRNRHLPIGKNDWTLYTTVFGIPLFLLVLAALFDQNPDNLKYCDFRQESGFAAWHYGLVPVVIIGSFLLITMLYVTLFIHILWQKRRVNTVLQQSAVNATRLAVKLSLFVVIHFIQFVLTAVKSLLDNPSTMLYRGVVVSSVIGGILNGVVYFTVRKR